MKLNHVFFIAASIAVGAPAASIVRRHDLTDQPYIDAALPYPEVVRMLYTGYDVTAVLIGPNTLLTAGHNYPGMTTVVTVATKVGNFTTTNWYRHPGYVAATGTQPTKNDFCLARLSTPVSGISPVALYTGNSDWGTLATWVGYGTTGGAVSGFENNTAKVARAGTNVLDSYAAQRTDVLYADFDNGDQFNNSLDAAKSPYSSMTKTDLECVAASGDSGGGVFVSENSTRYLAGVISFIFRFDGKTNILYKYATCMGAARVASQHHWIRAGAAPGGSVGGRASFKGVAPGRRPQVEFELMTPGTKTVAGRGQATPDGTDYFSFTTSLRGAYDLYAKAPNTLRKKLGAINVNGTWGAFAEGDLIPGDVDGNNYVNTDDYLCLSAAFDTSVGDSKFDPMADLDFNDYVGTDDYLLLSANIDQEGD